MIQCIEGNGRNFFRKSLPGLAESMYVSSEFSLFSRLYVDVSALMVLTKIEFYVIIYGYVFIKSAVLLTACRKLFMKKEESIE